MELITAGNLNSSKLEYGLCLCLLGIVSALRLVVRGWCSSFWWRLLSTGIQVLRIWVWHLKALFLQQVLHLEYSQSFFAWFPQSSHFDPFTTWASIVAGHFSTEERSLFTMTFSVICCKSSTLALSDDGYRIKR